MSPRLSSDPAASLFLHYLSCVFCVPLCLPPSII
jgi:hypothetical protein